jgi:hypothetical protein
MSGFVARACSADGLNSSRSAVFAYRIGSVRHDSRYSAIDISVWLRASNDLAKALNNESLYMIPLHGKCRRTAGASRATERFGSRHRLVQPGILVAIGHPPAAVTQCKVQTIATVLTHGLLNSSAKGRSTLRFGSIVAASQHRQIPGITLPNPSSVFPSKNDRSASQASFPN